MFLTISDKKTGEEIVLKSKIYNIEHFTDLIEYIDNISDFDFHIENSDEE